MGSLRTRPGVLFVAGVTAVVAILAAAGGAAGQRDRAQKALTPTQVTLTATADAYVEADTPTTNYGTSNRIKVDSSPDTRTYLRFDLSGITAPIVSASLQLMPTSSLTAGFEVHAVSDNTWTETGVNYSNAPTPDSSAAATSGAVTANVQVSVDVTQLAAAAKGGALNLALVPRSATVLSFTSRETATPPQLVVTYDPDLTAPVNTAPPTVSDQQSNNPPISGDTLQASPGTWNPAATSYHYQWQDCTPDLSTCTNVGTDAATYVLSSGDVGSAVKVVVTASNQAGSGTPAASAATAPVARRTVFTLTPLADSYVESDTPDTNYGTSNRLKIRTPSPELRGYLRFDLSGITAPITNATLQLMPTSSLTAGFEVHGVADNSWTETGITYTNAPQPGASAAATSGPVTANTQVSLDVTQLATAAANGPLSIALVPLATTTLSFTSRETATPPQLVVTTDPNLQPPANTSLPTVADQQSNNPPISGDTLQASPGTWSPAATTYHYQWQSCTSNLSTCSNAGSDQASYVTSSSDVGSVVRVVVSASNAAGAGAPATSAATAAVVARTVFTLTPVADTYVESDTPSTNYGTATRLKVDSSPDTHSFLRFDLTGITAPITSATLKLMPTSTLAAGFEVHRLADNTWTETGVTYNNAPQPDTTVAATSGPVTGNTLVSLDITQLAIAAKNGPLNIALMPLSATGLSFMSRETATPPQLVVTTNPNLQPPANVSPPTIADQQGNNPPLSTDTLQASPGTWNPSADAFHYQWQHCNSDLTACVNIGADSATYALATSDIGFVVHVTVTASNQAGAGAPSTSVATAPVAAPPVRQTFTLSPVADSYVESDTSTTNYGARTTLRVDSSPDTRAYLKFDLSSINAPIVAATLKVTPTANLNAGVEGHAVADTTWTEKGITYANAPLFTAGATGISGPLTANVQASIDVLSAMPPHGGSLVSLAIVARSSTTVSFSSREGTAPPQLVVTVDRSIAPPSNTTLPAVVDQQGHNPPLSGDQLAADPGTWTNNPISFDYAWQECAPDLTGCQPVGTDSQVYLLGPSDVGKVLRVTVTATNQAGTGTAMSPPSPTVQGTSLGHDPVIMAAGDIACGAQSTGSTCAQGATSDLILGANPDLVLPLGDNQYECGSLTDYNANYAPTWGRLKAISRPVSGNHEYTTSSNPTNQCYNAPTGAPGYYQYFGSLASPLDAGCTVNCKGYYSYDIGAWHLIALNSNCTRIGGCTLGDAQVTWLQNDLAAHAGQCILAYYHHPRWTSGQELPSTFMDTIYRILYANHVDLILNGHDHDYERFAPLDPDGNVDPVNGIREIIAGTGGRNLTSFVSDAFGSEVRDANTFGVLRLVLHPTSYEWQFVPALGGTFTDAGAQPCHYAAANDTVAPTTPAGLTASAVLSSRVDLAWQTATDNVGVVAYRIYRNGTLLTTVGNLKGFSDNGAQPSTSYTYTVSAVDASGNESPPSAPATVTTPAAEATPPFLADGFETDTLDHWTNIVGSVTVDSTTASSGQFSAHVIPGGQAAYAYNQFAPTVNELWLQAKFKVSSMSTMVNLFRLRTSAATAGSSANILTVYLTNTGKLGYRNETTAVNVNSATSVSTGVWHTLLLHVRLGDATTGLVETTLDGTSVPELTGPVSLQSSPIGRVQIGDATSGHTFDASFDDLVASTVAPTLGH